MRRLAGACGLAAGCLALALLAGCDDEDGGGDPVLVFYLDGLPVDCSFTTEAFYSTSRLDTFLAGNDSDGLQSMQLVIPGGGTGVFATGSGGSLLYIDPAGTCFWATDFGVGESYTITVTAYGPVGGLIEGTFSGTLTTMGGATHVITNGYFSVRRDRDL